MTVLKMSIKQNNLWGLQQRMELIFYNFGLMVKLYILASLQTFVQSFFWWKVIARKSLFQPCSPSRPGVKRSSPGGRFLTLKRKTNFYFGIVFGSSFVLASRKNLKVIASLWSIYWESFYGNFQSTCFFTTTFLEQIMKNVLYKNDLLQKKSEHRQKFLLYFNK